MKIETNKASGGGWNVHVYIFGRLIHTLWTAGGKKDATSEKRRLETSISTVFEPYTFRDGTVKDAHVTWFNDYGSRRCIAVTMAGAARA